MDLTQYIYNHFGVLVNDIQPNKYTRFKSKGSNYYNCTVFNKINIAWITVFTTGQKLTWLSESHRDEMNNLNKFQRDKYLQKLQEESNKSNEANSAIKLKYISEVWERLPKLTSRVGYLLKKDIPLRIDYKGFKDVVAVPLYHINGSIGGIQYLSDDKKFGKGSCTKNTFYPIKQCRLKDAIVIYFVEGIATAESLYRLLSCIYDHTNYAVITCFSAMNVNNVVTLFKQYFNMPMIIVADNDNAILNPITTCIKIEYIDNEKLPDNYDIWDITNQYGIDKTKQAFINNAFLQGVIIE